MTPAHAPEQTSEKSRESFRWRVRLSDRAPEKLWGVVVCAILAAGMGWIMFRNPLMVLIGFAIILGSTAEYWLGTSFAIDEKGASARTGLSLVAMEWADVKRVIRDEKGIRLSPLEKAGTMDAFRGVYLRYGTENREAIERAILDFGGVLPTVGGGADGSSDGGAGREDGVGDLPSQVAGTGDPDAGDE